jgi:hypothetical protein
VQGVFSQVNTGSDIGFSAIGKVTSATQRDTNDPLSGGGTVGINGRTIIIPDNTICTLPANTGACSLLFAFNRLAAAEFLVSDSLIISPSCTAYNSSLERDVPAAFN